MSTDFNNLHLSPDFNRNSLAKYRQRLLNILLIIPKKLTTRSYSSLFLTYLAQGLCSGLTASMPSSLACLKDEFALTNTRCPNNTANTPR